MSESYREISKRCGMSLSHSRTSWSHGARTLGSDIIYFTAVGSKLLVLNSFEVARDLLDRKGATYSSRPRLVVQHEL